MQDKRKELLAGEMNNYYRAEPKSLQADAKAVAIKEWKLLDEEHRSAYQERAAGTWLTHACMCYRHFLLQGCKQEEYMTMKLHAYCSIASCLPHLET